MIKYTISLILKAQGYVLIIIFLSFVIEKITILKLLIHDFFWEKSDDMAAGSANIISIGYFFVSLFVMIYNVYVKKNAHPEFSFWIWLLIMIPLTVLVRFLYYHLQARDPTKKGFHVDYD